MQLSEFRAMVGPVAPFRPFTDLVSNEIVVVTKDVSYTVERVNNWLALHFENHRPWWAPWKKCVGFTVYCPPVLRLSGTVPVTTVLERLAKKNPDILGEYRAVLHRMAGNLTVHLAL